MPLFTLTFLKNQAANTFLRSLAGAIFPLFAQYMFNALGVNWSGTLLGCVAVIMCPIPVAFFLFGARIRQKSKFAPTMPPVRMLAPKQQDEEAGSGQGPGAPNGRPSKEK